MTLTEQEASLHCVLCTESAVEVLPMPRLTVDDDLRPGVPLCVAHRREWLKGFSIVGWCRGGTGHYGRRTTGCIEHGSFFTLT